MELRQNCAEIIKPGALIRAKSAFTRTMERYGFKRFFRVSNVELENIGLIFSFKLQSIDTERIEE